MAIRIGIDSGEAIVAVVGDSTSKQHKDLIGLTINLTTKIQSKAQENQIVIGATTARNLHVNWRRRLQEYKPSDWNYGVKEEKDKVGGAPYALYFFAN